ncbi:hypothetical protein PC129_g18562 [Phytophthora cactorum]|uniref:Uncharacterized protein n=1 Tax=Phytophthora cactorum TaxID=29920 RepID=A0A8T1FEX3_9STRA|nr:hypothetical protein Pcac1_g6436 [Phytophthora cactorum]KAG2802762.1 hypothetical protein PC111_g18963 [Phytophthora cactorum]KAG2805867.1 hypothetical protein PC112_g18080 [Phytophthora cactorum]KAG2891796.1 hypothetical protein PC114_g16853 [Phytophthora cactorum]KAG2902556.1 hypothetical protein PC117_g21451 [Phytophthora cactorum]
MEGAEDEALPAEEEHRQRVRTRLMGARHVPVARVDVVVLKDPKNYRSNERSTSREVEASNSRGG